jgi:cellobiose epimerase
MREPSMLIARVRQWLGPRTYPERAGSRPSALRSLQREEIREIREKLEKLLLKNIVPFWYPRVLDVGNGGYLLNHDLAGQSKGGTNKRLVAQARTLWFFSRLLRTRYTRPEYAEAARHGFEFMAARMWDEKCGGFYWEVSPPGDRATLPYKHLYGQAFALYAISEYAASTGDQRSKELASRLFEVMERRAHDKKYGGYAESFGREWNPESAELGGLAIRQPRAKTMNTHIHLLEAVTRYCEVSGDSLGRERLVELMVILSNSVLRKASGICTDRHEEDWRPLLASTATEVSYGHNMESIHLLMETSRVLGLPHEPLLDFYRTLTEYSIRHGFDDKRGGFFSSGPLNGAANRLEKIWWVEAESLLSMLELFCLTGEEMFLGPFLKTLDWIVNFQADWENGEWFERITPDARPAGVKAGPWKCPYHNGRAVIRSLELLDALEQQQFQ